MNSRVILYIAGFLSLLASLSQMATAQSYGVIVNFDQRNGGWPEAALTQGSDGLLYGTSPGGGDGNAGLIFRLNPAGGVSIVYTFCEHSFECIDGEAPVAPLIEGHDGAFYGTAQDGGARGCNGAGCGTVFRVTTDGAFSVLHKFVSGEGGSPTGALIQATDGNFYGTTQQTIPNVDLGGGGTIFKMTPKGRVTVLHRFTNLENNPGFSPTGSLVQASDGNLYGTTGTGGDISCNPPFGCGTVYRMTLDGVLTVMHVFEFRDGEFPYGALVEAADGNLYGTSLVGGDPTCRAPYGCGTIYRLDLKGNFSLAHAFTGQLQDGDLPFAGVIAGSDGNLYGVSTGGGSYQFGTIFSIDPEGDNGTRSTGQLIRTIHSFGYSEFPAMGALVQSTTGDFYGTTQYSRGGPSCDCGVLFTFSTGLGPFVALERYFGRPGDTGRIIGQGFTGTTDVLVNGVAAAFNVISDTELMATVPAGATSGYVTVTTPGGTLTSNKPFKVVP